MRFIPGWRLTYLLQLRKGRPDFEAMSIARTSRERVLQECRSDPVFKEEIEQAKVGSAHIRGVQW